MASTDPAALAAELRDAEHGRRGIALPTERFDDFGWDDARAVARARDELRRADGDTMIGYKLGWTSAAMREALGIDRPNWGTLWASQALDASVDANRFIHAKIEPELVYVADVDLVAPVTVDDVAAACRGWAVGLEVVDPRFPSFRFDWLDNTADNSSAAGVRTGPVRAAGEVDDPASVTITFDDGTTTRSGTGDQAMGSPLAAVAWLVAQLAGDGDGGLAAGHLVYTGGLAAPFDVEAGRTYSISAPEVGATSLAVTAG